jgi:HAD superfamily hydrolase (TIGR01662 family)
MLYAFDADGTLIESFLETVDGVLTPVHPYERVALLPGRRERLAALVEDGHRVAIVTNQGGVAFGQQTDEEVFEKFAMVLHALGLDPETTDLRICMHHPRASVEQWRAAGGCERRKPSGLMIQEAMMLAGVEESATVYVGDLDTDRQAADDAGCSFYWAEDFFGAQVPA